MVDARLWEMYASADDPGSPHPLRHFGPLGFALQDKTATRVLHVVLTSIEPEEAEPGDYWAWLDLGASEPSCIGATEQAMTDRFLIGENVPGPREEQAVGQGQILRLRITELGQVYMRAQRRRAWKISSAQ